MKKYSYIYIVSALVCWGYTWPVAAAPLVPCNGPDCRPCHLLLLVKNIINFAVFQVMAPLAGLAFLIGGIMMVAAAGSEARYQKGKKVIKNALIGVIIVMASWIVVNTLITTLGGSVDGFQAVNWYEVQCQ